MKKSKKVSIIIAIIFIFGGLVLYATAVAIGGFDINKLNSVNITDKSYIIEEKFHNINIESAESNISFAKAEDNKCRVECREGDKIYHTVTVENDTLTIRRVDIRKWYEHFSIYWKEMKITVYLPKTEYDSLYIRTISGDVNISDKFTFISAEIDDTSGDISFDANVNKELKTRTVSGGLSISNTKANKIEANSTSGDVTLTNIECSDNLQVGSISGNLSLKDIDCDNITVGNTSGDNEFINVTSRRFQCESVSGNINLYSCDADNLKLKTTSGNVSGSLLTDKQFKTESISGKINVPSSETGGICEITTVSGDINITTK